MSACSLCISRPSDPSRSLEPEQLRDEQRKSGRPATLRIWTPGLLGSAWVGLDWLGPDARSLQLINCQVKTVGQGLVWPLFAHDFSNWWLKKPSQSSLIHGVVLSSVVDIHINHHLKQHFLSGARVVLPCHGTKFPRNTLKSV